MQLGGMLRRSWAPEPYLHPILTLLPMPLAPARTRAGTKAQLQKFSEMDEPLSKIVVGANVTMDKLIVTPVDNTTAYTGPLKTGFLVCPLGTEAYIPTNGGVRIPNAGSSASYPARVVADNSCRPCDANLYAAKIGACGTRGGGRGRVGQQGGGAAAAAAAALARRAESTSSLCVLSPPTLSPPPLQAPAAASCARRAPTPRAPSIPRTAPSPTTSRAAPTSAPPAPWGTTARPSRRAPRATSAPAATRRACPLAPWPAPPAPPATPTPMPPGRSPAPTPPQTR